MLALMFAGPSSLHVLARQSPLRFYEHNPSQCASLRGYHGAYGQLVAVSGDHGVGSPSGALALLSVGVALTSPLSPTR